MLDTVILNLPSSYYQVLKPEMFTPNANILRAPGNNLVKCVNNPTSWHKKQGIYVPRLTLMKRTTKTSSDVGLKIEFSASKMIYGNNMDEIKEIDFEKVVSALRDSIFQMGVVVLKRSIRESKISGFHASKNIELTGGYTSKFVITELGKINASKKMDLNRDSFRNSGSSLQFYTNSHSLVIYDKVQDLHKVTKRAIDKDQNYLQRSLFEAVEKKEVLRIEVRLTKKVKMNSVLRTLNLKENPSFQDIFKRDLCRKVLLKYWNELIVNENLFLFDTESSPKKVLNSIFRRYPDTGIKNALYLVGLKALCREGMRDVRAVIEQHATTRTWLRISQDMKSLEQASSKVYHDWVKTIESSLENFQPLYLSTTSDCDVKNSKVSYNHEI